MKRRTFLTTMAGAGGAILAGCTTQPLTRLGQRAYASESPAATLGLYPEYFGMNPSDGSGEPGGSTAKWSELYRFEGWLGRPVAWLMQFGWMAAPSWAEMEKSVLRFADADGFRAVDGSRRSIVALPLTVRGTSLASVAKGAQDAAYRRMAERYVQAGLSNVVFRLGWELDNRDFPWTMRTEAGGNPTDYRAAWRRVHDVMMSVPGAGFEWCLDTMAYGWTNGASSRAASVWPGTDYVDYCGVDIYDSDLPNGYSSKEWVWKNVHQNGLDACAAFAESKGKPVVIPEWACAKGTARGGVGVGGDNPYYIAKMVDWIETHNVAWHCYFNRYDPFDSVGSYKLNPLVKTGKSQFPNAAAAFRTSLGV